MNNQIFNFETEVLLEQCNLDINRICVASLFEAADNSGKPSILKRVLDKIRSMIHGFIEKVKSFFNKSQKKKIDDLSEKLKKNIKASNTKINTKDWDKLIKANKEALNKIKKNPKDHKKTLMEYLKKKKALLAIPAAFAAGVILMKVKKGFTIDYLDDFSDDFDDDTFSEDFFESEDQSDLAQSINTLANDRTTYTKSMMDDFAKIEKLDKEAELVFPDLKGRPDFETRTNIIMQKLKNGGKIVL